MTTTAEETPQEQGRTKETRPDWAGFFALWRLWHGTRI
nr:MAG TPA: hypothetical protein [Caudoviricetes sp.]